MKICLIGLIEDDMQLTEEQLSVLEGLAVCSSPYEQDVLRSILAAHNAGAQEPVAWMYQSEDRPRRR